MLSLNLPPCCHGFLPYITGLVLKWSAKEFKPNAHMHHVVIIIFTKLTLCYSIISHATLLLYHHTPMLTLHYLYNITCTLVATGVILGRWECNSMRLMRRDEQKRKEKTRRKGGLAWWWPEHYYPLHLHKGRWSQQLRSDLTARSHQAPMWSKNGKGDSRSQDPPCWKPLIGWKALQGVSIEWRLSGPWIGGLTGVGLHRISLAHQIIPEM